MSNEVSGRIFAANEAQMVQLGTMLGQACRKGAVVFLYGNLGMGKTTLARGVLQAFGHQGVVKSPTYTLVEPYETQYGDVFHFDLYRLADPEELEYLGIRDYFDPAALCLIEWPDQGKGFLPDADLVVTINVEGEGRQLNWQANTERGLVLSQSFAQLAASM